MTGAVIVTSAKADRKLVNRLLLNFRDWESTRLPRLDYFQVVTTQEPLVKGSDPDTLPLKQFDNKWAGKTVRDTELFMAEQDEGETGGTLCPNPFYYLVLDDQGVEEETIILTSRDCDYTPETGFTYHNTYQKVRLPWRYAAPVWVNLDIANMGFEEFIKPTEDDKYQEWCTFRPWDVATTPEAVAKREKRQSEARERMNVVIQEFEKSGDA